MVGYWLTTISFIFLLLCAVGIFILAIKSGVNTEDAHRIDPDPTQKVD